MSDEATLRDVTVEPNPAQPAPEPAAAAAPPPEPEITDTEAAEIGRIMLASGYTKERINEVLDSPRALSSLRYMIENNPKELLNSVERVSPKVGEKFLETMADEYVARYGEKGTPAPGKGKDANSELMSEVDALRSELKEFRTNEERRQAQAAMAQTQARYNARVDDLFSQVPKEVELTKSERAAMRALLDKELAADPTVVQRVSNGNFVDVPMKFKSIVDQWSGDRKAAADAAKTARERTSSQSFPDFSNGAQPFSLDIPKNAFDSWDNTETELAKALERSAR